MNFGKEYENVPACGFVGALKDEEMSPEFTVWLKYIIRDFIVTDHVRIFYSPSHSDFDLLCESIVLYYRQKYRDILLIKYASKKYKRRKTDNQYDQVINSECSNYYDRCCRLAEMCKFVIYDSVGETGAQVEAYLSHIFNTGDIPVADISVTGSLKRFKKIRSMCSGGSGNSDDCIIFDAAECAEGDD